MINVSKDVQFLLSGDELDSAVIKAISTAKQCYVNFYYDGKAPDVNQIQKGTEDRGGFFLRAFDRHDDHDVAPFYNKEWVHRLLKCGKKVPEISDVSPLVPNTANHRNYISSRPIRLRFPEFSRVILHLLWYEKAILLPLEWKPLKKRMPITRHLAKYYFPEVLALVLAPWETSLAERGYPDISDNLTKNISFKVEYDGYRFLQTTTWHRIEDVKIEDLYEFIDAQLKVNAPQQFPFSPALILSFLQKHFPERCTFSLEGAKSLNSRTIASKEAVESGAFFIPEEIRDRSSIWLEHQQKFIDDLASRGIKQLKNAKNSLGILNAYLFEKLPAICGYSSVPYPVEFTRAHLEGIGNLPGFLKHLKEGREPPTVKGHLYQIETFFGVLASRANAYPELKGFENPILPIDYPFVRRRNSTKKTIFESEHFLPLLQFMYGVEAFAFFLVERTNENRNFLGKLSNTQNKVYNTEELGFVPVIFTDNPHFDDSQPVTEDNRKILAKPIPFIHKSLIPILPRKLKRHNGVVNFPTVTFIHQTILALETGMRFIHIRWLDRRTYDKHIQRSHPLPPICDLHVNTDKVNGPWDAKVRKTVIELLDRQKEITSWFDEPVVDQEAWYDFHENSDFGRILTLFPRGMGGNKGEDLPGPYSDVTTAKHFKRFVFAFDLFCHFSLGIRPSSPMHESFRSFDNIDDLNSYVDAFGLFEDSKNLIQQTPHSCRATVVSKWITILPPHIIGKYITGHATTQHVLYYAKVDPEYLHRYEKYQVMAFNHGLKFEDIHFASIQAEDQNSKVFQAFKNNPINASNDFGATSFDRTTDSGETLSGLKEVKKQALETLAFQGTHICPFNLKCPPDIVKDLKAIQGIRRPCGGCYYSVKTVDHMPRISAHIRSLTDEATELKDYIDEAKKGGASIESLRPKAEYRRFLADEIAAWTISLHCLEQMLENIKDRDHFLVERPEMVLQHIESVVFEEHSLQSLMARIAEAKNHSEFFTPQLKGQVLLARNLLIARTGDFQRALGEIPRGSKLLDEFRGIVRSICETLDLSVDQLAHEIKEHPRRLASDRPQRPLTALLESTGGGNA